MKKIVLKIWILAILAMIILPTTRALAADPYEYTVLAPLPGTTTGVCDPNAAQPDPNCKTTLGKYLPGLFNLLIGLSAAFAVLMIVIGGLQYISTDAIQKKSEGKERIKNAVFGLVLVISAWLILNTINKNLLKIDLNIDTATTAAPGGTGGVLTAQFATGSDLLGITQEFLSNVNRDNLERMNVLVNNPPCTSDRTSNCTNLNGLPAEMMESLVNLQKNCAGSRSDSFCAVVITGGTETSLHTAGTSHGPGKSTVDLRQTDSLNKYLGNPSPQNGDTTEVGGLKFTYESAGANSANTGSHWHVTAIPPVKPAGK